MHGSLSQREKRQDMVLCFYMLILFIGCMRGLLNANGSGLNAIIG